MTTSSKIIPSKIKTIVGALSGALLIGSLAFAAPAAAGHWSGGGGYRHVVVHRHIVHRPVFHRVVYVHRPVVRRVVRRVVVVERPFYAPVRYGWHHRIVYRPGWRHHWRWHDRPRCWLPERHLCH